MSRQGLDTVLAADTERADLEIEKAALEDRLAESRQQRDAVQAELSAVSAQLSQRRDDLAQAETQNAALMKTAERIPILEDALEKSRKTRDALQAEKLNLEKRISELTTTLDAERRQQRAGARRERYNNRSSAKGMSRMIEPVRSITARRFGLIRS